MVCFDADLAEIDGFGVRIGISLEYRYPVITSAGENGDWLGNLGHPVEGAYVDCDFTSPDFSGSCPELRVDDVFVATDRGLHEAASAITIGLLPSQTSVLCNFPDITIANGLNIVVSVDDRRGSRRNDGMRWRLVLTCGSGVIDRRAVIGTVGDHAGDPPLHHCQQAWNLRDIAGVLVRWPVWLRHRFGFYKWSLCRLRGSSADA